MILIVVVLSVLTIRHLQRAFFYPMPGEMPDVVTPDINVALHRFEMALANHAPDVLSALQLGLSDKEIASVEAKYRLRLTEELRSLYRWRNGSGPETKAKIEIIPGHWFAPLEYAAQEREEIRHQLSQQPLLLRAVSFMFVGHRTKWLGVLDDLCGDGYFYDPGRRHRSGSFFYHFAEDRQYRFFPSLSNFLTGAAECYETEIYKTGRRAHSVEDVEREFALWSQYASWPRDF
jgi:cell wall assembly regulator SMI1